jgi:hypothetical protein
MARKKSRSSQQDKQVRASELFTTPLTDRQQKELQCLASVADPAIDFSDAPAMKMHPRRVVVGRFWRERW